MIYLASPFTSKLENNMDKAHQERTRALEAAKYATKLWAYKESPVYSPIAHGFALEQFMGEADRINHDRWMIHCFEMLDLCDEVIVLCLDGWRESKGVAMEIERAENQLRKVKYLWPNAKCEIDLREYAPDA